MATPMTEELFLCSLHKVLNETVEKIKQEIIENANEEFNDKIRKAISGVAINLCDYYSLDHFGSNLRITVKLEGGNEL